jgi:ubiquinol-cytochrome c reductase cytochrome c1 subunit
MFRSKQDYVYALLTGYVDPPPGVEIREGLNYNPYFPGGAIGMARVLYDGLVEFEDGTPATTSQMAKDVTTFLAWASEPELDQRKKMGMQASIILTGLLAMSIWVKKFKWAGIKSRKLVCELPLCSFSLRRVFANGLPSRWGSSQQRVQRFND